MQAVEPELIGRLGNQLFIYAHARAYAEQNNCELRTVPWVGEELFAGMPIIRPQGNEIKLRGYRQRQEDLIYTRRDCKRWFAWKPEVARRLRALGPTISVAAHLRRGDYAPLGYVVVSQRSYERACLDWGLSAPFFIAEEYGHPWLEDFYRLQQAGALLRANSTFSWWAATLSEGQVYSPIIAGLEGGKEQDCQFVSGNWPRLANLELTTDLHLPE